MGCVTLNNGQEHPLVTGRRSSLWLYLHYFEGFYEETPDAMNGMAADTVDQARIYRNHLGELCFDREKDLLKVRASYWEANRFLRI